MMWKFSVMKITSLMHDKNYITDVSQVLKVNGAIYTSKKIQAEYGIAHFHLAILELKQATLSSAL